MKDLTRLFNGLTLIANEFAKRSLPARTSDFETLIKTALLSATKGQLRQFSPPQPSNDASSDSSSSTPSVVVFSDSTPPPPPSTTKIQVVTNNDVFAEVSNESEFLSSSETVKQSATTSEEVQVRKRKPRERKVPATPFSRALGLVFFKQLIDNFFYN